MPVLDIATTTIVLVLILNRSSLFQPLREYLSKKWADGGNRVWWFFDEVFDCELCMSMWMAMAAVLIVVLDLWFVVYCGYGITFCYLYIKVVDYVRKY